MTGAEFLQNFLKASRQIWEFELNKLARDSHIFQVVGGSCQAVAE